jgi:enediyne polyketide synthase
MVGEATGALVTGALADLAQRLSAAAPGCRALHVDWPAWAGGSLGERSDLADRMCRAGFTPMQVTDGSRQLLKLLATDGLPDRVAVHGRVGVPAPRSIAAAAVAGPVAVAESPPVYPPSTRFIERVLVHYPGVELVAEAKLSLLADPYLGDYKVDGVPVLPPVMALEAMAQAASVLAGASARRISQVRISAPVVLPAGTPGSHTVIRLAALRDGDAITVTLRSDNSGFAVEHGRAVFSAAGPDLLGDGRQADATPPGEAAGPSEPGVESVGSAELYGSVFFQDGRFRRLSSVRQAGPPASRGAIGLADDTDERPWFCAVPPARAAIRQQLVLGSAGLNDATLQLVQACVPDRTLAFESCDQVTFSGREAAGPVTIRAVRAGKAKRVPSPRPAPRRDAGQDASWERNAQWTVDAVDSDGSVLIAWRGLRMRDAGPLPQARRARRRGTAKQLTS